MSHVDTTSPTSQGGAAPANHLARIMTYGVAPLIGVFLVVLVSVTLAVVFREDPDRNDDPDEGLAVFASQAMVEDVTLSVTAQGEVRPRREITLSPQVAGRITYVSPNFIDGGFFQAGEVLLRIDPTDYELALTRAEGQVAQARSALQREEAEADIAREDWEELGRGPASSLTLREPQLAEARAQLAAAEASLADARLALERTEISAPFVGRVRTKAADLGQYVTPNGGPLGEIYATDVVEIRLPLTDSDLAQIGVPVAFSAASPEEGAPVLIRGQVLGQERVWRGAITRTNSEIDSRTRVIFAVAEVHDPFGAGAAEGGVPLPVGLFVRAEIAGRTIEEAVVLPRQALRQTNTLYVANLDGTLSIRTVQVLSTDRQSVIVSSQDTPATMGVRDGEYVVTSTVLTPEDCMRVRVLDPSGEVLFPKPADPGDDNANANAAAAAVVTDAGAKALSPCAAAALEPDAPVAELAVELSEDGEVNITTARAQRGEDVSGDAQ